MNKHLILGILLCCTTAGLAQPVVEKTPNPRTAFLKSLAIPGWGHHYVDKSDWRRGKYHTGADAVLILSFFGLSIHSNNLQQNWFGYARTEAGIDIENRSRTIQLAVGDFNNLAAYNDFQARSRNWDQFINDIPENRWNWENEAARQEYNDLRGRFENIDQQLPALVGFMVVNRLISAVSAYNRARNMNKGSNRAVFSFLPCNQGEGAVGHFIFRF